MWMNSINKVEQSDAISPLNHDISGAFSRKGKIVKKINRDPQWLDTLLVVLFVFFLPAIDLILFAGSGDLKIVSDYYIPIPEVGIVLGGILAIALLLIVPFHKKRIVKYSLAASIAVLFIYVIFCQFFLYSHIFSLGNGMIPLSVAVALLVGGATFAVFQQKKVFFKVLYVIAFAVMFVNVYSAYSGKAGNKEFEETYNIQKPSIVPAERFIYFMLPNLESYAYLTMMNNDSARKTQDIMQGFYQKNKFIVYSKAYVPENNYYANMIRSLNPTSNELSFEHRLNTRLLDKYWSFHNLKNEYVFIKNNELYDIFKKKDYQISAYKSRDFDMCHQQHQFNVERCVEKINKPINLYNTQLPVMSRAGILAVEWIINMRLFDDASFIYNMLSSVTDIENVPMVGTDFNNLYVVNADKTFDVLFENIKQDSGKQAYFVFMDLPSDMYIYDEYCQIKPQNKWISMINLPWIRRDYKKERQEAYLQQTRCLFGKMSKFIENLRADNMLNNTTIIIQGTSGVNDFSSAVNEVSVEQIMGNRIVNMAIFDALKAKYEEDERFCTTNQILKEYLFKEQRCENNLSDYHQKMVDTVVEQLNLYNRNINANKINVYENWYDEWKKQQKNTEMNTEVSEESLFETETIDNAMSETEVINAKTEDNEAIVRVDVDNSTDDEGNIGDLFGVDR